MELIKKGFLMHAGLAKLIIRLLARSERNIWNTLGLLMKKDR